MSPSGSNATPAVALANQGLVRFVVFLCTAGWAFPHVCTEGMDLTKIQNDHRASQS
jgi:hypothetical protein